MEIFGLPATPMVVAFVALLLAAALYDIWKYQIPNALSAALAVLFVSAALTNPFQTAWWSYIGGAAAVLASGLALYYFKWLGAGDVKFMSAAALFAGFGQLPMMLAYILISGGALALALVVLRRLVESVLLLRATDSHPSIPKIFVTGEDIPYGVAIAVGAAVYTPELAILVR